MPNTHTGYASVDKPWLKFYSNEPITAPQPELSLYEYFLQCSEKHLDHYALNYFGKKITFREMISMIDEVSKAFIAIGVKEKEIVPIVSISTVPSIICFYALNKIGAVSDYLNVLSEEKDLQALFEEVNAKIVVTLDVFGQKVLNAANKCGVKTVITFGVDNGMPLLVNIGYKLKSAGKIPQIPLDEKTLCWKDFVSKASEIKSVNCKKDPNELCLLTHTGGTTGTPKAVMLSDKAMNAVADGYFEIVNSSEVLSNSPKNSVFLQVMIPFVVYGILTCMHMPLCMGWCLAIIPKFDGADWNKYFKKYRFNYVFGVPAYISGMFSDEKLKDIDFSEIRTIAMGGDGMNETLEKDINSFFKEHGSDIDVVKGYGLSEVSATAVSTFPGCNKIGSVGIPLYKNNMMVYDNEKGCEQTYNEVGEICLQCASRMMGYMDNEDATKELFKTHADGSEWLHTGDLGYVDEDGFLFLVGRMKRVILTTKDGVAYKVFPNTPEEILDAHEAVVQSCIVGVKDGDDQVLRAHIVLNDADMCKCEQIEKELRIICDKELPSYSRPTFYRFCESLPLTAAGKVDYRSLEDD